MGEFNEKRVTIKDVAQKAGVSLGAVNKALAGKPGISEKRRKEIIEIAHEMGYQINSVAQIMSRKPMTIGVVIPYSEDDKYFKAMKMGMEKEFRHLEKYKVNSAFYFVTDDEKSQNIENFTAWLLDMDVKAVCICPRRFDYMAEMVDKVIKTKLPLFLSGGGIEPPEECITMVSVDSYLSGRMAADFLYAVNGKNIKAAVFGNSLENITVYKKVYAFTEWLKKYGVGEPAVLEDNDNKEITLENIKTLLAAKPDLNSIYVSNANCLPIVKYIEESGLKDKITVVATDYSESIKGHVENGTINAVLLQNEDEVGRKIISHAYNYLVKHATYGNEDLQFNKRIYIKPEFCMKSSFFTEE